MTIEEIFNQQDAQTTINMLRYKQIAVPAWEGNLENEYDVKKHPVYTDVEYHKNDTKNPVSTITLGWAKLAVKRISELAFGIPVQRVYKPTGDKEKRASELLEAIYQKNRIDSVNLKRAKVLYAACETCTIWYGQESKDAIYAGQKAEYKLRCRTYSPMKGERIYPLFDDAGDLIALSVEYSIVDIDKKTHTYFDTYTADLHVKWEITSKATELLRENITLGKISGVYINRDEPIYEDNSHLCHEAEWTLSRNGNYIRKNARPTFVISTDRELSAGNENNSPTADRNVIRLGKGETAGYATWQHANEATKFQVETIKREYFTQLQLPDMSMDEMKTTPMSGEARKMLFIDAQMKVTDESGIWLEFFDRELNVIREHAALMFPEYAAEFHSLQVEHVITPYSIKDDNDKITNISTAKQAGIMSTRTAVQYLGYADDVDAELKAIAEDESADLLGQNEPTM